MNSKNKYIVGLLLILVAIVVVRNTFFNDRIKIENGRCIRCNVILISADSVRADHMSLYGAKNQTTPSIDQWAKKALVFDQFFSSAFLTPISEASVHTGLYPEANGITGFRKYYGLNIKPLAQILKENGYMTMAHGDSPEFRSFESLRESFSQGFDYYLMQTRIGGNNKPRGVKWKEIKERIGATKKPFFLWVPMGAAHSPFGYALTNKFADQNYQGPFKKLPFTGNLEIYFDHLLYKLTPERRFHFITSTKTKNDPIYIFDEEMNKLSSSWPMKITDEDLKYLNDMYDNGIGKVDDEFAKLQFILKETGHDKDTVIIFESEHGESLGEHKYIAHYDIYDTTVHVPLVISSPAIKNPQRSSVTLSGVDILPTLLNHLNLSFNEYSLDGKNFLENGNILKIRDEVYIVRVPLWETILKLPNNAHTIFDDLRALDDKEPNRDYAIRNSRWKLIHRKSREVENKFSVIRYVTNQAPKREEFELYDLKNDPKEITALPLSASADGELLKTKLLKYEEGLSKRAKRSKTNLKVEDYH